MVDLTRPSYDKLGIYTFAQLPSAVNYPPNGPSYITAWTTDQGPVYSDGANWHAMAGNGDGAVSSVNGQTGAVSLAKADIGLSNVDNTSNVTERAATATLANKTLTSPVINTPTGIVKGDVGLGNVDNTSNATERTATATLTNKTLSSPVINTPTGIVKGDVGLGSVENTALSTWVGSASITTLGTIAAGVWNGTAVAVANGGTGSSTAATARTALASVGLADDNTLTGLNTLSSAEPRLLFNVTGGGGNGKLFDIDFTTTTVSFRTRTDIDGPGQNYLTATRTAASTTITNVTLGNSTSNPTYTFAGTGTVTANGGIIALRFVPSSSTVSGNCMYLPGTNRLGWCTNGVARGEFDASGNFSLATANFLATFTAALPNGAAAAAGTILNAPTAGNPTKWVPVNDNGTTRYSPLW